MKPYNCVEVSPVETPYLSYTLGQPQSGGWRQRFASARQFWEPRRLIYNLILASVVAFWVFFTWPHFHSAMNLTSLLRLAVLASLANLCYSAAYLVELTIQRSTNTVKLNRQRWGLWSMGTLFAVVLENYWIVDEIYPFVR
jgi:hypothetical protein